jgi:hypothetical protein
VPEPESGWQPLSEPAVGIRVADEATVTSLWTEVVAPRAPFLSACRWTVPSHPSRGWSWVMDQGMELLLVTEGPSGPGVVFGRRELPIALVGQLVILLPERAGASECRALAGLAIGFAFQRGFNKCEWPVESGRPAELEAAALLGFVPEVTYADAYLTDHGRAGFVLFGVLRAEWEGRSIRA